MKTKMVKEKLNKFERTRILSARALEIAKGAKPKIKVNLKNKLNRDFVEIARQEYEKGKLDLEIYKK